MTTAKPNSLFLAASGIRDNHRRGSVGSFLQDKIQSGSKLSIVSAYFTIYAFEELKTQLTNIEELRFLFGEPRFVRILDPDKTDKKQFQIEDNGLTLQNRLVQKPIARACANWIKSKVQIRSVKRVNLLHGKMYHITSQGLEDAIMGSSNFTLRGLGLGQSGNNIELNLEVSDKRDLQDLKAWFNEIWDDKNLVEDVKDEVLHGRIDRIGSINSTVQMVNFWPTEDLNKYIDLKNRVEARMALVDITATQEDNLLANVEEEIVEEELKYRDKQLLRLREEVLDLEEFTDSVSLTDFSLNDFRMELSKYIESHRRLLEEAPLGLYAVVPPDSDYAGSITPGVIFCLRQKTALQQETVNPLQPYFLVYVGDNGQVRYTFAQPKQILEIYRHLCARRPAPLEELCHLFDRATQDGTQMEDYNRLVRAAVKSIDQTFKQRSLSQLQSGRGAVLFNREEQATETSEFELITWLVVYNDKS